MDLSGRKLRVEYKKMLPLAERERIEREKRERRGQLEEQHRPVPQSQLHNQVSMSSLSRNTPSPLSHRSAKPGKSWNESLSPTELINQDIDMNDAKTLEFYTNMTLFKQDPSREVLIFPPTLEPHHRRVVHTLAHHMGLMHTSRGSGEARQVHIHRPAPGTNVSPPTIPGAFGPGEGLRQTLARSSTADFSEGRQYDSQPSTPFEVNLQSGSSMFWTPMHLEGPPIAICAMRNPLPTSAPGALPQSPPRRASRLPCKQMVLVFKH